MAAQRTGVEERARARQQTGLDSLLDQCLGLAQLAPQGYYQVVGNLACHLYRQQRGQFPAASAQAPCKLFHARLKRSLQKLLNLAGPMLLSRTGAFVWQGNMSPNPTELVATAT
jgi:hypothetical protein